MDVNCYLIVVLISISLMISDGERFSCAYWPFVYLLQTVNAAEGVEKGNPPTLLVGM